MNCAATKTLALGIPLINIIFASSPNIGLLSTPLIIYHAEQLIVGAFYIQWFCRWIKKDNVKETIDSQSETGQLSHESLPNDAHVCQIRIEEHHPIPSSSTK